uniref:NHL repeat containing 4 n=1 Tax=Astatotilapia calliptera TaxID=8154 RepID=A0A3P8RCV2_ASTCA
MLMRSHSERRALPGFSALLTHIKQFGKQGSGRTDFNLPSGIHATVKGQLFVVDCGNARIQVTDLQKNVVQQVSPSGPERSSRICNYFDVAVNSKGLIALTCAAERAVLVFSRHGRLLQTFGGTAIGSTTEELDAPRGVTVNRQDEFLVADIKRGTLTGLKLDPKTGARLERTVVTGYHRPYLVAACLTTGLMAISERGNETGRVPCIRVLEPGWNTIRILGVCSGLGPVLTCPWGLCIDSDGDVLVTDWGKQHHPITLPPPCLTVDATHCRAILSPTRRHNTFFQSSVVQWRCLMAQASLFVLF